MVNAYTVAFAALILSAGALGDRIGAKRVFIAGFSVFTLASAVCGLAPTLGVLIGARAIQGAGAALLVPCSLTLLNHTYPEPAERSRAIGRWAVGASAALSAGPLVGGVLTATLGWRAIFFINAPIGLIGILLTARFATETSRSTDRGIDLWGQLTAILCLTLLAAATIRGGSAGFGSAAVLAGYAAAAIAGVAFLAVEARRAAADAAVAAVSLRGVRRQHRDRAARQRGLLRAHLRLQPVLPARRSTSRRSRRAWPSLR